MNVEIGTEASQFPEKEYINGIFLAVYEIINLFAPEGKNPQNYILYHLINSINSE
jgi:hypothetical protein